jgi:hypothetical protein
MYTAIDARPLKEVLRENGVRYGDVFTLSYKSNGTNVGYYDRGSGRSIVSNKEYQYNSFSFLPGDKIWILKQDDRGYIMINEKEENYIKAMDPHFLQRVITLIMTERVKINIIIRTPKRGKIFKMIESLFGSSQHLGEII